MEGAVKCTMMIEDRNLHLSIDSSSVVWSVDKDRYQDRSQDASGRRTRWDCRQKCGQGSGPGIGQQVPGSLKNNARARSGTKLRSGLGKVCTVIPRGNAL